MTKGLYKIRWKPKGGIYGKKSSLHSRRESQDITRTFGEPDIDQ